jgi:hypothetical protein
MISALNVMKVVVSAQNLISVQHALTKTNLLIKVNALKNVLSHTKEWKETVSRDNFQSSYGPFFSI